MKNTAKLRSRGGVFQVEETSAKAKASEIDSPVLFEGQKGDQCGWSTEYEGERE